jgi:hypothetical protein
MNRLLGQWVLRLYLLQYLYNVDQGCVFGFGVKHAGTHCKDNGACALFRVSMKVGVFF